MHASCQILNHWAMTVVFAWRDVDVIGDDGVGGVDDEIRDHLDGGELLSRCSSTTSDNGRSEFRIDG